MNQPQVMQYWREKPDCATRNESSPSLLVQNYGGGQNATSPSYRDFYIRRLLSAIKSDPVGAKPGLSAATQQDFCWKIWVVGCSLPLKNPNFAVEQFSICQLHSP
jgi:hypothetical protein